MSYVPTRLPRFLRVPFLQERNLQRVCANWYLGEIRIIDNHRSVSSYGTLYRTLPIQIEVGNQTFTLLTPSHSFRPSLVEYDC